ncbi:MAG TPA: AMP-binding protein [Kineosporiaceae bacterium]
MNGAGSETRAAWWAHSDGALARLLSALAAGQGRVVLRWRDRDLESEEVLNAVAGTVTAMATTGIGRGDVVAVLVAPNSPDMLIARWAANLLGAAVCHLRSANPVSAAATLSDQARLAVLERIRADVLFTDQENEDAAYRLLRARAGGAVAVLGLDVRRARSVRVRPGELPPTGILAPLDPDALACVAFTTGTTGLPKGIRFPLRVWENTVAGVERMMPGAPRLLCTTPLDNTVGPMVQSALARGGSVVLHERFDPCAVAGAIAAQRITELFLATPFLHRLLDCCRAEHYDLSSLRAVIYGGSPADPARLQEAVHRLGSVLVQGYGTTETGVISVLLPAEHRDRRLLSTVGRPLPHVNVEVREPGSGPESGPADCGEIWVRSPHMMTGYLGEPDSTAQVLRDGWFRTGDIGRLDEQGYLHLLDRVDDVVKIAGVKVYPAVVEQALIRLLGVAEAAVLGVRTSDQVEHLCAALVMQPGAHVTAKDVRAHLRAQLSDAHVPEDIQVLQELPLTPTGKPDRRRLRQLWRGNGAPRGPGDCLHPDPLVASTATESEHDQ